MASQVSHFPHIKNVKAARERWDPMHSSMFLISFVVPAMMKGEFNEDEFVNFLTGKDAKDLIFEDNSDLSQKRFKIEDYAKLYELIGGTPNGINKADLQKNIKDVLRLLIKCEDEETIGQIAEEQAKEIIELLGSNEDGITPEDFMNIMTSNTTMPENIEDVL